MKNKKTLITVAVTFFATLFAGDKIRRTVPLLNKVPKA